MKRSFIFIGLGLSGVCLLLLTGIRTAAPPFQSRPVGRLYLLSDQSRSIAPDVLQVARLAEGIAAAVPTVPLMAPIQGSGSTSQTITASGTAFVGGGGISIYSIAT